MLQNLQLLDMVVQECNAGCDILRAGFTPETTFSSMRNILSMLTQTISADVEDRLDLLTFSNVQSYIENLNCIFVVYSWLEVCEFF